MKPLKYIFFLWILVFQNHAVQAQQYKLSSENKKALSYYKEGERSFVNREYGAAEIALKKAIAKDEVFIEAWLLLGDVHTDLKKPKEAIADFQKAVAIDPDFFPRVYYFLGKLENGEGNYQQAIDYLEKYLTYKDGVEAARQGAIESIKKARFAIDAVANPVNADPVNLGQPLSSSHDEYINFVNETQNQIVLTRKVAVGTDTQNRLVFNEQFFNSIKSNGQWQEPKTFDLPWNDNLNMGGMNLSVDGRKMYFTGCNWPDGFGSCDLYVAFKTGNNWDAPTNMGAVVNSQWWDSQPAVSSDGKRIYFSSKRSGGKGGTDIWMAVRLASGKWSPAINLGDSINSPGNEMAPFLHADGKTLYFSSDGHIGLGGSDLFMSRLDEAGRWSQALNLGYPINSKADEINIQLSLDGGVTWISSNREGGYGGFDLYNFGTPNNLKPSEVFFVKGIVKDKLSGEPLFANVQLTNLLTGIVENEIATDAENGQFLMVLNSGVDYAFNISSDTYLFYSENFNLLDSVYQKSIEKVFELEPLQSGAKIILNNIFFDFNSSVLTKSSDPELNKLTNLLQENETLDILITGHTDSVGDAAYNEQLSTKRAEAVYLFLIEQGIDKERLSYKGFGSSNPIATNESEEGRAQNRRTEIEIL